MTTARSPSCRPRGSKHENHSPTGGRRELAPRPDPAVHAEPENSRGRAGRPDRCLDGAVRLDSPVPGRRRWRADRRSRSPAGRAPSRADRGPGDRSGRADRGRAPRLSDRRQQADRNGRVGRGRPAVGGRAAAGRGIRPWPSGHARRRAGRAHGRWHRGRRRGRGIRRGRGRRGRNPGAAGRSAVRAGRRLDHGRSPADLRRLHRRRGDRGPAGGREAAPDGHRSALWRRIRPELAQRGRGRDHQAHGRRFER